MSVAVSRAQSSSGGASGRERGLALDTPPPPRLGRERTLARSLRESVCVPGRSGGERSLCRRVERACQHAERRERLDAC